MRGLALLLIVLAGPSPAQTAADPEAQVPLGDPVYADLARLSGLGLIADRSPDEFEGGLILTRGQAALLVGRAAARVRAAGTDLEASDQAALDRLVDVLRAELEDLAIDASTAGAGGGGTGGDGPAGTGPGPGGRTDRRGLPGPTEPAAEEEQPAVEFHGRITQRWSVREGKNNDRAAMNLDMSLEGDFFLLEASGTIEEDRERDPSFDRQPGDHFLDPRWTFDLNDRAAEIFHRFLDDDLGVAGRVGNLRNLQFAEGLVVGALDLDGYQVEVDYDRRNQLVVAAGQGSDRSEVGLAHLWVEPIPELHENEFVDRLALGGAFLDLNEENGPWLQAFGFAGEVDTPWLGTFVEWAKLGGGGWGLYARARTRFSDDYVLEVVHRHYEAFVLEVNNAPIYSGVSGADDEDEIGFAVRGEASPWDWLFLEAAYDVSRRPGSGRRLHDYVVGVRLKPTDGWTFEAGFEYEREHVTPGATQIQTYRVSRQVTDWLGASIEWRRDDDGDDNVETFRASLDLDAVPDRVRFTLTDTLRRSDQGKENVFETRVVVRFTDYVSLSASFTHNDQDDQQNQLDLVLFLTW